MAVYKSSTVYRKKKNIEQSEQWMIFQRLPRGDFSLSKKGWLLVIPSAFLAGVRKGTTASGARKCWSGARLMQRDVPTWRGPHLGASNETIPGGTKTESWLKTAFFFLPGWISPKSSLVFLIHGIHFPRDPKRYSLQWRRGNGRCFRGLRTGEERLWQGSILSVVMFRFAMAASTNPKKVINCAVVQILDRLTQALKFNLLNSVRGLK